MIGTILFSGVSWMPLAIITIVTLAALLFWAGYRSPAGRGVKLGCGVLKVGGIAVLAMALLEPVWVNQRARPGANYFALVADNSQSLRVKDNTDSQSRGDILRKNLLDSKSGWQAALEENFQVRRYYFDTRLQSTRDFTELNFDGRSTALGASLKTAVEQWRGQPFAGVLLFTDGNATDIASDLPPLDGAPPIYPVVLGKEGSVKDISLKKVAVSQTAFEDAPVVVQTTVGVSGFLGKEVVARLTELATGVTGGSDELRLTNTPSSSLQLTQTARDPNSDLEFRFQVQPAGPGLHFYELETRLRSEFDNPASPTSEATLVNNRQMIVVDRGQEPFRILYVGGRPNWEYKFLNRAIQDDTQVRMVSLIRVARREPKFQFKGRPGETSNPLFGGFDNTGEDAARYDQPVVIRLNTKDELELRGGFPKTAKELFQFNAVIVGDLESEFFTSEQKALLQRFVSERGGGFLMLGGAESFREGNYANTPIGSMLPVYLDRPAEAALPSVLKFNLTREGWLQPWTRLRGTENEERDRLESLPAFEVWNPARDIKPGASVLATVSDPSGKTYPALAVQRFGLGRSAALMIGDLFSSGLRDEASQKDLAKSWRQLARWLVADVPSRVSITADPSGDGLVRLTIKARDDEFKPLENSDVRLTVRFVKPADPKAPITATNFVQITAEPSSSSPGTYEATYLARDNGAYSAEAVVTQPDGTVAGRAATGWTADVQRSELNSLEPNRPLLESLAGRTGGQVVPLDTLDRFVRTLPDRRAPITETYTRPIWDKPVVFLFVLACFVAEWGIRRWKGLP